MKIDEVALQTQLKELDVKSYKLKLDEVDYSNFCPDINIIGYYRIIDITKVYLDDLNTILDFLAKFYGGEAWIHRLWVDHVLNKFVAQFSVSRVIDLYDYDDFI